MELSRPTVRGKTAWGNNTVSRTGKTGMLFCGASIICCRSCCSGAAPVGSVLLLRVSDAIEFILDISTLTFDDRDAREDAVGPICHRADCTRQNRNSTY